jgi:hypothetical protein
VDSRATLVRLDPLALPQGTQVLKDRPEKQVLSGRKVSKELQEIQVLPEPLAPLAPLVPQVLREIRETLEPRGLEILEPQARLARVPQVPKEIQGQQDIPVHRAVLPDPLAQLDLLDPLALLQDLRAHKDRPERLVHKEMLVSKVSRASRDLLAIPEELEARVLLDKVATLVPMESKVKPEPLEARVPQDRMLIHLVRLRIGLELILQQLPRRLTV